MNIILYWFTHIFMFLFIASIVIFNVARVIYWIKCFKLKECSKRSCLFKDFCYKYYMEYTDEEIERVQKMIDQLPDDVGPREPKE